MKYTIMCLNRKRKELLLGPDQCCFETYRESFSAALQSLEKSLGIPENTTVIEIISHGKALEEKDA